MMEKVAGELGVKYRRNGSRVLAFNDRGRAALKEAKKTGDFLNAGQKQDSDYCRREYRIGDLYGLFAQDAPEAPGAEENRRVYYHH